MEINSSFKVPINSFSQIFAQPPPTTVPDYSAPVYQSQINPYAFQYTQGIHQAPVTNLTSGHPTFYFKERKTHLNWDKIDSIDLDEVRNGANKHLLEACLGNVVFAKLSEEDCEHFHDPVLLKMFRLSQYGLEYMLNYQNYLFSQMQNLDLAYRQTGDTLKPMEMQARENQDEIQRLKEEIYMRQQRIDTYEKTLKTSIHKCKHCQKCFKSREYLREHMKRRHAVAPKPVNTSQRIVMRDISTSPLVAKNAENSFQKQPSKQEQEQQQLKASQERERETKVLAEKGVGDDTIFINETHNNATIEKIKEMLDHIREGDNKQLSQLGELLQEKFQEVLKANDEIGHRVQQLQNKVEGSLSYSKQDISGIHVDEEYEDKENRSINANRRREGNTSNKGLAASNENIFKNYENKRSPNQSAQEKSAKKAVNYEEEYGGRSGIREKGLSPAETQQQVAYQVGEHYNRENMKEHGEARDYIRAESRTAEKRRRKESGEERVRLPEETPTKGLVAQLSQESAQLYHKDDTEANAEKEKKQSAQKEVRESQEMRPVNRRSPNSPEILEIEEYQDSGELAKYAKAQVADIEKNRKAENGKDIREQIEEAAQTEEEEPIYEDEEERERTMRIIEGTMGLRGDEDKMLEKDKRAFMRAKEAMEKKYTFEEVEPKEAEEAEEHVQGELMSKFKKLFGEDYETLAGRDVTNLEEILGSLRLLNQQQTQRFNQMKDDFQKTQRRSISSLGEDRKSIRKSSLDEEPVISSERQDMEGKESLQTDSQKIRKAKESLAELEQLIKESQDSRSHISLCKE